MGGRKSYSVKSVLGNLNIMRKERNALENAVKKQEPIVIARATLDLLSKSKSVVDSISNAIDMFPIFENKGVNEVPNDKVKNYTIDYWDDLKQNKKLKVNPVVDKILIDSAVNILKRRGKK